jgi:hypothetical protein
VHVLVQHLESGLYLASNAGWVKLEGQPLVFSNAVKAISFCIQRSLRDVRLVNNAGQDGKEVYVYPFGQDPVVKAEGKKLRRFLAENRRLLQQKRMLLARLDDIRAEAKERKKRIPFLRKLVAAQEAGEES